MRAAYVDTRLPAEREAVTCSMTIKTQGCVTKPPCIRERSEYTGSWKEMSLLHWGDQSRPPAQTLSNAALKPFPPSTPPVSILTGCRQLSTGSVAGRNRQIPASPARQPRQPTDIALWSLPHGPVMYLQPCQSLPQHRAQRRHRH